MLFLILITIFSRGESLQNLENETEVTSLKHTAKVLAENLEKWNNFYLNSLESKMISTATSLANIDSNIKNLQERAHVWDTFQLHVGAWNDQLATLDRKADIISKGQETILALESKINAIINLEYKIDEGVKKTNKMEELLSGLKEEFQNQHVGKDRDSLVNEFAIRGILSSVKMIEKKLDRLLLTQQNALIHKNDPEQPRLNIKCSTPRFVEDILKDVSSKVDVIFDKLKIKEENDYNSEDYLDDSAVTTPRAHIKSQECKINLEPVEEIVERIENVSKIILEKNCQIGGVETAIDSIVGKYFVKQKKLIEAVKSCPKEDSVTNKETKNGCDELNNSDEDGVYVFGNTTKTNSKNRSFNKRYCVKRNQEFWTVIQKRDNYFNQNFNSSWFDYKNGFGDLDKSFWFGNDFINQLSKENLVLRIELEDFEGNQVWAEYHKFVVLPEEQKYKLLIGRYKGNASDSFSSHNGSSFSTFDVRNDEAPECCPCAESYGAGWWFNSCFEANLNGPYFNKGAYNGHYGGIIWETWKGNYSLKKSLMMVRKKEMAATLWPYYEDP